MAHKCSRRSIPHRGVNENHIYYVSVVPFFLAKHSVLYALFKACFHVFFPLSDIHFVVMGVASFVYLWLIAKDC